MDNQTIINELKIELHVRENKVETLKKEIENLRGSIIALTPRDPQLEELLDEEERIEARTRINQL